MAPSGPPPPLPRLLIPKPDPDAPPPVPLTPDLCAAALRREYTVKPDPDAAPAAPARVETITTPLTAEICAALRRELEPDPGDNSDFARQLRLNQQRLDRIAACLSTSAPPPPRSPAPSPLKPPPPPRADPKRASSASTAKPDPARAPPSTSSATNAARASSSSPNAKPARPSSPTARGRKRIRGTASADMVRATVPTETDILQVRTVARRARLTFEALRRHYHRRAASEQKQNQNHRAGRNRADMRALSTMISRDLCLYRDKRIVGPVPGVFVGDVFSYRAELNVVGLHNHTQAGIGFVPASLVSEGHPVATSIVASGLYLDDRDNGDVLVYTGSGGRPRNGGEHLADQAFERGNLALAYSCKYGVEVRVIRCHDCDASPSGKVYVYDGLYKVESSTYEPGKSGREVCKFNLVRLPGQDPLGSNTWHAARKLTTALEANLRPPGYLTLDLSRGKEALRVPVCNTVDHDRSPLDDFKYVARPQLPPPTLESRRRCCSYTALARGSRSLASCCACLKRNGGRGPPYNADGTLVKGRPVVYECGAQCVCPASCPNRVTQRGMRHRLEVFRSKETEWGVRTLDLIQPGAFVCEFSGDLVVAGNHSGSTDWDGFVDPRKFPPRWKEWGDASAAGLPDNGDDGPLGFPQCPAPGYVLDVSERRNFAPYICHSGAPNVFFQFVLRADESELCPHIMVFAMETIPPMGELTIDYGID